MSEIYMREMGFIGESREELGLTGLFNTFRLSTKWADLKAGEPVRCGIGPRGGDPADVLESFVALVLHIEHGPLHNMLDRHAPLNMATKGVQDATGTAARLLVSRDLVRVYGTADPSLEFTVVYLTPVTHIGAIDDFPKGLAYLGFEDITNEQLAEEEFAETNELLADEEFAETNETLDEVDQALADMVREANEADEHIEFGAGRPDVFAFTESSNTLGTVQDYEALQHSLGKPIPGSAADVGSADNYQADSGTADDASE